MIIIMMLVIAAAAMMWVLTNWAAVQRWATNLLSEVWKVATRITMYTVFSFLLSSALVLYEPALSEQFGYLMIVMGVLVAAIDVFFILKI